MGLVLQVNLSTWAVAGFVALLALAVGLMQVNASLG